MNKRMASQKSTEGLLSIGELRTMIKSARELNGRSQVNAMFSMREVCDVYEKALEGRDDAEIPLGFYHDVYKRRDVPSKDSLIIRNILRDCA
jgi:hypothetical protein